VYELARGDSPLPLASFCGGAMERKIEDLEALFAYFIALKEKKR
jgi:hypothetical protein